MNARQWPAEGAPPNRRPVEGEFRVRGLRPCNDGLSRSLLAQSSTVSRDTWGLVGGNRCAASHHSVVIAPTGPRPSAGQLQPTSQWGNRMSQSPRARTSPECRWARTMWSSPVRPLPPCDTMPSLNFEFADRPVILVRDRLFVLLTDLRPNLGIQLLAAADVTAVLASDAPRFSDSATIPVWYDGSGVCYIRPPGTGASRVTVTDLPIWVGLDVQGGLASLLQAS